MMELRQDLDKGKAGFTAVSEFLLTHPVLSFGVRDVSHSRMRHTEVLPAEEESESMSTGVYPPTHQERLKNEIKKFNFNVPHFFMCLFSSRGNSRTNRVKVWDPD